MHMLPTRDPPQDKRPTQTEVKGWKRIFQANGQEIKSQGINTNIRQNRLQNKSHKRRHRRTLHNTQWKNPSRRHEHYEHIYTQHRRTNIYKETFGGFQERYRLQHIYILGDVNIPLATMDRSSKENINKDISALNNVLDQMDITDIYRTFHSKEAKYTFFSNAHGTFSKIYHMIEYVEHKFFL